MPKNTLAPTKLAQELIGFAADRVTASIRMCQGFAQGWAAYENDEWREPELEKFLATIHAAGIGPDPYKTILNQDHKPGEKYKIPPTATWFFIMKAVGEHSMFNDEEVLGACKVSSYSTLYALARFHNLCLEKYNPKRAKSEVMKLLAVGGELTRSDVEAKIKQAKQASKQATEKEPRGGGFEAGTLSELIEAGSKYDTLLLTPSDELLDTISNSSWDTFDEQYAFGDAQADNAGVHILANGTKLNAALQLAEMMGELEPTVYGLAEKPLGRVVDFKAIKVLVSSKPVDLNALGEEAGNSADLVREALTNKSKDQLHLFADSPGDGWTTVGSKGSVG